MLNPYEMEKIVESQKSELDCVSRQGWKWKAVKKGLRKFSFMQLFAPKTTEKTFCQECLDC